MAKEAFVGGSVTEKVGNAIGFWTRSIGIRWGRGGGKVFQSWKNGRKIDLKTSYMPCEGD